ncbi:MAG TPA: 3-hydroxyacyl-ACP dehydratase FabZ [Phycisphaerae bacterium]|nr:3-hydroxyacyl-ACP dehydratase FabZ [Phycisphaerae bacterium]HNU45978.1 3-hydroxyacyl-ACP dehydratase FabZ [Phycisphaerae bacterium]
MTGTMTDDTIYTLIPHRPPFLFIDRVVELTTDRAVTTKRIDPDAEFFRGHYPGQPIMPGVLLCEAAFQTGALLLAHRVGISPADRRVPVLTRITEARFKQVVLPGQTLSIEVQFDEQLDEAYFLTGRVSVEGKLAVRVSFACMMTVGKGPAT